MRLPLSPNAKRREHRSPTSPVGRGGGVQQPDDFAGHRMPSEFRLFEDRLPVARDVEPSAARGLELDVGTGKNRSELGRQTGGPRLVTSNSAILDLDSHPEW